MTEYKPVSIPEEVYNKLLDRKLQLSKEKRKDLSFGDVIEHLLKGG